ncbi:hypothetical protein EYY60_02385 [Flavobacterium zhairuonense]|uniref:hypothetical protein n=1 Tax=Flavobacterium zhairuonense TaxID=2493631 RepID=UPI00104BFC74|nr:hypothetical protein [Flavobacterium zhairuonense]KAF2515354.1 hypothetical protein EYY60_02385 [Flavobacterium zhairuonense]
MKTTSTSVSEKKSAYIFIFLTSLGLGYVLAKQFIFGKPDNGSLVPMICLFVASIASWLRKKYSKK